MSQPRVLLLGYYGRGNYGDDVLMCVAHRIIRNALPTAEIFVQAEGHDCHYITKLLPNVRVLPPSRHGRFDYIIHGGGGVFFDLHPHGVLSRIRNQLMLLLGARTYVWGIKMLRCIMQKPATHTPCRLGIGIGVGAFSAGSPRLRAKLPILADFKVLWVRDTASLSALAPFRRAMHAEIFSGSDLAFLTEFWDAPKPEIRPATDGKPKLGIVLRDWPVAEGEDYASALSETLRALAANYAITGFVLDASADPKTIAALAPYTTHIWQPEQQSLGEFAALIAAQQVVLTSRAHGAIIAACMGVPSAIVAIEPKLAQVHGMLPLSSVLAENQPAQWHKAVAKALAISSSHIDADVARNRAASEAALAHTARWFV